MEQLPEHMVDFSEKAAEAQTIRWTDLSLFRQEVHAGQSLDEL